MSATKKSPNFKSLLKSKQNITPIKTKEDAPSDFELNEEENVEEQIEVNKKRKIEEEEDVADDVDDVDLQDNDLLTEEGEDGLNIFGEVIGEEGQEAQEEVEASENTERKPVLKKGKLDSKKLEKFNAEQEQRGIVYFPSIPPRMNPRKMREIMAQFGQIHRSFLVPEKDEVRKNRKKAGGNRGLLYVEGWVEFADKKIAKRVAQSLNGTTISKQGSRFHRDFVWNIKYLSKVKWHHLTEKISYERAFMLKKLRTELSAKKRENEEYLRRSEKAKISQRVGERAAKRERKKQLGQQ